jgi:hypothetical protein
MPSANVLADAPTTRSEPRHERSIASAFLAPTPMMRAADPMAFRTVIRPQAPLPPPIGTSTTSASGSVSKTSRA